MDDLAAETDRRAVSENLSRITEYHGDIRGLFPVQMARVRPFQNVSRISFFRTLPTGLRGWLSQKSTDFGAFTLPSLVLQSAMISSESTLAPCFSSTTALTASPHFSSGTP